ncbi:FAS1 domain-containing protein [Aspergillus ellipticus CBS 707.79]|uniref:FAS1 domain-containing protein n=1 Tax=Aspergillus ellipticus CBS 707.79 TaxID=1448320 RepID=A0A319DK80_9EURO|nr:FAS1 domain-containing protein [Aspergillus ellipticus CBS 707.79]
MKLPIWPLVALPLSSALLQEPLGGDFNLDPDLDLDLDLDTLTTSLASALHHHIHSSSQFLSVDHIPDNADADHLPPPFRHPPPPPYHRHPPSNKTLYDLIYSDPDTTILARLIHTDAHLTDLLNATTANLTLFAPTDHAFRNLLLAQHQPHQNHNYNPEPRDSTLHSRTTPRSSNPSESLIHRILQYHIVPAMYSPAELFQTHSLPTMATEVTSEYTTTSPGNPNPNPHPNIKPKNHNSNPTKPDNPTTYKYTITTHPTKSHLALNGLIPLTTPEKRSSNGLLYHIGDVLLPAESAEGGEHGELYA